MYVNDSDDHPSINRNVALTVAAVEFFPSVASDCKIKAHFLFFFPTS